MRACISFLLIAITSPRPVENPCIPSPCGPNAQCRVVGSSPACSCLPNYLGRPPNCRPECVTSQECPSNLACRNERCVDPCPGSCGAQALCTVVNHNPVCTCPQGYVGDAFVACTPAPITCKSSAHSTDNANSFFSSSRHRRSRMHFHSESLSEC